MLPSQPQEAGPGKPPVVQALHWASCHPGILLFGTVALAALLATPRTDDTVKRRPPETEADIVEGEDPLFI